MTFRHPCPLSPAGGRPRAQVRSIRRWIVLSLMLGHLGGGHAFLPIDDGGGGGGAETPLSKCLANTRTSIDVVPSTIALGGGAVLSWSIEPPEGCSWMFDRVLVDGQRRGLSGSIEVRPTRTTDYPVTLLVPGGFKTLGPVTVTVVQPDIVTLSPGPNVGAQDIAQFDARWMSQEERDKRINEYKSVLMSRQAWIAWGVFDDASAMVRMFELTNGTRYLDHLRRVAQVALDHRDDLHPGNEFPPGLEPLPDGQPRKNPICLDCAPPIVDRVRGKVMPAWGSSILYTDYTLSGGLNPIDAVTSGVYLYGIAAFARLVAEHPDPARRAAYAGDAMKFANAAVQTMGAFMPEWQTRQVGSFVEGPIYRPRRSPTDTECDAANARAKEHVRLYDPVHLEGLSKRFDENTPKCKDSDAYAGKPLAHNEGGALVMSFIELWRALDSDFYRTSPQRTSGGELSRGLIPLVATRHQRYFHNRLRAQEQRYTWHYNDDVKDPDTEDTSHANLDMSYVDTLRRGLDRLNAQVAGVGEPVALDDAMLRRFASTFIEQIARPAEIDRGGNVRGNVDGAATEPNEAGEVDHNNWPLDGWITLSAVDPTVYRLCRSVLLRTDGSGFQKYLGLGTHAALLAHKRFAPQDAPRPPRPCPPGRKCCELDADGTCGVCVPIRAQCP